MSTFKMFLLILSKHHPNSSETNISNVIKFFLKAKFLTEKN